MSLHPIDNLTVPEETARVARAAFPKGNPYMTMRDRVGVLYRSSDFWPLFAWRGQPGESPGLLAMVLVMQCAEGLTDRQAAEAVRGRIDWKYALGLTLTDPGFDHTVLSEFRGRLVAGGMESRLFDDLLEQLRDLGLVDAGGKQRTDSTHVLAAIRTLNRLECVGETLRQALEHVATVEPDWLLAHIGPDWFDRYGERFDQYRLPKHEAERLALGETVGADGRALLDRLYAPEAPGWLREMPAVQTLRQVWVQQYWVQDGVVRWRAADNLPPAAVMIQSPFDPEARYSRKRDTQWTGYKVHLTETCDAAKPHLITHVATTPATTPDGALTPAIHADLAQMDLLPTEHIIDAGYVDAANLVNSQADYAVELVGPVAPDTSWQGKTADAFDVACFTIDWDAHKVTCPTGQHNRVWSESHDTFGNPVIHVRFDQAACAACPCRAQCTQSPQRPRSLKIRPRPLHEALQTARQSQATDAFKQRYKLRAGVEGTISQGVRTFDLRRARYIGLEKTHLQHLITATAMNLSRAVAWFEGRPHAVTRTSRLKALAACA